MFLGSSSTASVLSAICVETLVLHIMLAMAVFDAASAVLDCPGANAVNEIEKN